MRAFLLTSVMVLSPSLVLGQPNPPSVHASAEAVVYAKPDQVRIEIGVVTQANSAQAAASQNATQLQTVLDKLRAAVGGKGEIRTTGYSLNPNYTFPRNGGEKPTISGYTATNTVQVTSDDVEGVGKVIDAATQAGANEIRQLQFRVRDERPVRAEALKNAARDARASAEAMASALGLTLGPVLEIQEGNPQVIRPMMAMAAGAQAGTPVQAGQIEVRVSVSLTVSLKQP
jgi:uncharacterized protein YggE